MLGKTYETQVCSMARALEVVGERWTLLILRDALFAGASRYSQFQRLGIATNVLRDRLGWLVDSGLMERSDDGYVVTEQGRDLIPAMIALTQWGDKWRAPDGPPIIYTHPGCDGELSVEVTCNRCGVIDDHADVGVRHGPGMPRGLRSRDSSALPD